MTRARTTRRRVVVELAVVVVIALVVSFGVRSWLVRSFFIPSASMERTLLVGDRVIVDALVPGTVALRRGDVIVFRDPGGWLGPAKRGDLIKRVIGLPGDRVTCCGHDGRLSVNGRAVDEPYITRPPGEPRATSRDFGVSVPADAAWVMGDNRWNSADSRAHGPVPLTDVVGRASVVSWPVSRWSWLSSYPDVWSSVPDRHEAHAPGRGTRVEACVTSGSVCGVGAGAGRGRAGATRSSRTGRGWRRPACRRRPSRGGCTSRRRGW